MDAKYKIKTTRLTTGERLPLLLNREGQPLFEPTVYTLTELRARNQATNTISNNLRAIQAFYLFLEVRSIDLHKRLCTGQLLSLGEVEDLTRLCRLPAVQLTAMQPNPTINNGRHMLADLETARLRMRNTIQQEVNPAFAATRLRYIRDYIDWLVLERLSRHGLNVAIADNLKTSLQRVLPAITARLPKGGNGKTIGQREGLAPEIVSELLRVTSPQSPDNPWRGDYARHRNALIIQWLYYLGLRRGELLGIKVHDIDFQKGTVTIHRRADDEQDPRTNQPQTKTKAREIPLSEGLKSQSYAYVMNHRSALKGSKKHNFLFCADGTGQPMALPTLNKVFRVLREKCPSLPESLCPHVLRHTWNDRFSEEMDDRQISEESEKKLRSYLMGWSETSGTAATYTRRHTRIKAEEVSLSMQKNIKGED